jgi:hypothetical protein
MTSWKKPLIEIITVIVLFSLVAELILGLMVGYGTEGQGKFKDGLFIEGDIEYKLRDIDVNGEDWIANFSDLSEARIEFHVGNEPYNYTVQTSRLTIIPNGSGSIEFYRIVNNSKINTITFRESRTWVVITLLQNQIVGIIGNTSYSDEPELSNVIFIADNEIINASSGRGNFYLLGEDEEIQYNISMGENYHISTYTQNGDIIYFKGDLQAYDFEGSIWSNGKLYFSGDLRLSGKMRLKILQNPETYYNHESHRYDWELEIEGKDVVVEGFGLPFWSIGLILSIIPSIIIVAYHIHKKLLKEKEKFRK